MAKKNDAWKLLGAALEPEDLLRLDRLSKRLERDIRSAFRSPRLVPPLKKTVANNQKTCGFLIKLDQEI